MVRLFSMFNARTTRDFSAFVTLASKEQKERIIKRAADQAIVDQRKVLENAA